MKTLTCLASLALMVVVCLSDSSVSAKRKQVKKGVPTLISAKLPPGFLSSVKNPSRWKSLLNKTKNSLSGRHHFADPRLRGAAGQQGPRPGHSSGSCQADLARTNGPCLRALGTCTKTPFAQRGSTCAKVLDQCQQKCPFSTCNYELKLEGSEWIGHHFCWSPACPEEDILNNTLSLTNLTAQGFLVADKLRDLSIAHRNTAPAGSFVSLTVSCLAYQVMCNATMCVGEDGLDPEHTAFTANHQDGEIRYTGPELSDDFGEHFQPDDHLSPSDFPLFLDVPTESPGSSERCGELTCSGRTNYCCRQAEDSEIGNRTYGCCNEETYGMFLLASRPLKRTSPECRADVQSQYGPCLRHYVRCLPEVQRLGELVASGDLAALNNNSLSYLLPHCLKAGQCFTNTSSSGKCSRNNTCTAIIDDSLLPPTYQHDTVDYCLPGACHNEADVEAITTLLRSSFCAPLCTMFAYWSSFPLLSKALIAEGQLLNWCPVQSIFTSCSNSDTYAYSDYVEEETCSDYVYWKAAPGANHHKMLKTWQLSVIIGVASVVGVGLVAVLVRAVVTAQRRRRQQAELGYSYATLSEETGVNVVDQ